MQGDVGVGRLVGLDQVGDVQAGEDVAVEDEDGRVRASGQALRGVADGTAGAEGLVLDDVLEGDAEVGAVTEVGLEDLGEVAGGHHDVGDTGGGGPGYLVGEEGNSGRRNHRLGGVHRHGAQSRPLPANQQDRFRHCFLPNRFGRTKVQI